MTLRRDQRFDPILSLGLIFLAVANVVQFLLQRHSALAEGPRDGISGLLHGLAIGCLLLGIWRMRRTGRDDRQHCA